MIDPKDETCREWCRRIGADLELIRGRVGGWRVVVVRLGLLVDAVDELVAAGTPVPDTLTAHLASAREALIAGSARIAEARGAVIEEDLAPSARRSFVRACDRYWSSEGSDR